jgi:cytochrome c556
MQDYKCRERLEDEDTSTGLQGFPDYEADFNQCSRVSAGGVSISIQRKTTGVMDNPFPPPLNCAVLKGLEEVKQRLASSCDSVRIAALKEALHYGKEGFQLVKKIIKTERGLVQLTAFDLLWEKANLRGKQKLLNYLSSYPEVCTNYIEKVLEPSLVALEEEQERQHRVLAAVCNAQERIRQQYTQAFLTTSSSKQGEQNGRIPGLPSNMSEVRQDEQALIASQFNTQPTLTSVSVMMRGNAEYSAQSAPINAETLSEKANTLKAQLDQQTILINNLLPKLVLISQLFEAKAKKYLFEAQTFAKAIEQIERGLFQIEADWQELESATSCEKSSLKLLERLESLIAQMQEHLVLLHRTVARAITAQSQIQHHYNLVKKAADYCKYRVQLDWQEGNEDGAHESLVRRKRYLNTAAILKFGLARQTPQLQVLKCDLFVLQSWLSLTRDIKYALNVESSSAWTGVVQAQLVRRTQFPYTTSGS